MLSEFLHVERALIEVKLNECRVRCLLLKKSKSFEKCTHKPQFHPLNLITFR